MSKWVSIAKKTDVSEGKISVFSVEGKEIAISYVNGEFFAFLNSCTHMELPLDEGCIEGTVIECPHHGAKFDLKTGKAIQLPAAAPLEIFKVKVVGDEIQIEL